MKLHTKFVKCHYTKLIRSACRMLTVWTQGSLYQIESKCPLWELIHFRGYVSAYCKLWDCSGGCVAVILLFAKLFWTLVVVVFQVGTGLSSLTLKNLQNQVRPCVVILVSAGVFVSTYFFTVAFCICYTTPAVQLSAWYSVLVYFPV